MKVIEFAYVPFAALPTITKGLGIKNTIIVTVILIILAAVYFSSLKK